LLIAPCSAWGKAIVAAGDRFAKMKIKFGLRQHGQGARAPARSQGSSLSSRLAGAAAGASANSTA
jgi:hypothetical protein